jgi:thiamine-phosphate pyrophosphorylase
MGYQFTPAVERALNAAAFWTADPAGSAGVLGPLEVLVGLLNEAECRAAKFLTARGVNAETVHARFAELTPLAEGEANSLELRGLSAHVESALRAAAERLDEPPRSFQFATEHVLLGLTLGEDEIGRWLRTQGVTPEALDDDQARRYGSARSTIAIDLEPIPLAGEPDDLQREEGRDIDVPNRQIFSGGNEVANRDERSTVLRVVDAAANRAGEALRVVEDYVRFLLDNAALMQTCKELRHELTAALGTIPLALRLAARDTAHDVGTDVTTATEMVRRDPVDVANANCRRLQESLRSLEEFAKLIDPAIAVRCEQLRYRAYELQKTLAATGKPSLPPNRRRLTAAQLYVLVDGRSSASEFETFVHALLAARVDVIQLRDKQLDDRTLIERGRRLREITRGTSTLVIMNDRPDLAVLCEADGVHVGQEELSVADARRIVDDDMLVGVSTHSIAQARRAVADGADYLGVGPTFPSNTKAFVDFPGLDFVRAVAAEISLPAFAIGGITAENIAKVVQAGLRRVAVSGAITQSTDPFAAIRELRKQLEAPTMPAVAPH